MKAAKIDFNIHADKLFSSVYYKIRASNKRYKVVYGGSNSSKSWSAHQHELIKIMQPGDGDTLIFRKHGVDIRESSFKLLTQLISDWGLSNYFKFYFSNENRRIIYTPTRRSILFKGLDDSERIKSIVGIKRIVLEEASEFDFEDFTELTRRARGFPDIQFTLILNPVSEKHWIKKNLCDVDGAYYSKTDILHFTYKDNKFTLPEDIENIEMLKNVSENQYRVYVLGQWGIEDMSGKFAYAFNSEKHTGECRFDDNLELYLSFDFNVNPICCISAQYNENKLRILKSFKLENSNIYQLCDVIISAYPMALYIVTGDATGRATSALVNDNLNYYKVIKQQLRLTDTQIKVPSINPTLVENRVIVNAVLQTQDILIDKNNCKPLIFDLTYCEVDENNKLIKDRSNEKKNADQLDCARYLINLLYKNILRLPKNGIPDSDSN